MTHYTRPAFLALALAVTTAPSLADETAVGMSPAQQFAQIQSWEGRWQVAETSALQIVFEKTARGTVMIERWETSAGLHSMTVYHMDGETLVATHYCPQGNQPRLESRGGSSQEIRFALRDVSDLDEGESYARYLWFTPDEGGTIRRSELYVDSTDDQHAPSDYTLSRVPKEL